MSHGARRTPSPPLPPTVEKVRQDHIIQRLLCHDLEKLADGLPALPSLPEVRRLCDRISRVTTTHFLRAEALFEALPNTDRLRFFTLADLRLMHRMDEGHAEDLVVALWRYAGRPDDSEVIQLAYMLRCFFDGCRRAVAFKESLLLERDADRH